MSAGAPRIGIDLGGTKIAGIVLGEGDRVLAEQRIPAPRGDYGQTVLAIRGLISALQQASGAGPVTIGIGMPGSIQPVTGRVQNANSTWLNGRLFKQDLEAAVGQPVRLANDANCFALSEAADGAAAGARSVFGVILGTGCGGALVHRGNLIDGPLGIGGEWGHNPLPWMTADEFPGPRCWCGRLGCLETFVSGSGLAADHARIVGSALTGEDHCRQSGRRRASRPSDAGPASRAGWRAGWRMSSTCSIPRSSSSAAGCRVSRISMSSFPDRCRNTFSPTSRRSTSGHRAGATPVACAVRHGCGSQT